MICPKCCAEYRDGFTECSDCLIPLVDELPAPEPEAEPSIKPPKRRIQYDARREPGVMVCPNCGAEYRPGFTRCADCDVELVEPPLHAEPDTSPAPDLVTVLASGDAGRIALAKSLLQSAGIPFVVVNEAAQDLFAWGVLGTGFNIVTGPAEVQVRAEDADDAQQVLEPPSDVHRAEPDDEHS